MVVIDAIKAVTCEYFEHSPPSFIHQCKNEKNLTKVCGFSVENVSTCPLVGKLIEKEIRPASELRRFGLQFLNPFGILQVVYDYELRSGIRRQPTDKFPTYTISVPLNELHRFSLLVEGKKVGFVIIDADSYGELEVYEKDTTGVALEKWHSGEGITVKDLGSLDLLRFGGETDAK